MLYFIFIALLTHPLPDNAGQAGKLAFLALPLSTCREGGVRWRTWGESRLIHDNKPFHLFNY
jgi:hypothetical protein